MSIGETQLHPTQGSAVGPVVAVLLLQNKQLMAEVSGLVWYLNMLTACSETCLNCCDHPSNTTVSVLAIAALHWLSIYFIQVQCTAVSCTCRRRL